MEQKLQYIIREFVYIVDAKKKLSKLYFFIFLFLSLFNILIAMFGEILG